MSDPSDIAITSQDVRPPASKWVIPEYMCEMIEEDPEVAGEILNLFFETATETIEKLAVSIRKNESNLVHQLSHTLTGSTRQLGANDMADLTEAMETSARRGDLTGMCESTVNLKSMLESLYAEVQNCIVNKPGHVSLGSLTSRIRRYPA
jgi:HPt (histidine-containing phosphotransfer) domain-containing protein